MVSLCVSDIRKETEKFFVGGIPRGIEESIAVCERELEERICSLRRPRVAELLGRDPGVGGDSCWRPGDVGQWKKAVEEALEERHRRRNVSADQSRERRRLDGLLVEGVGRKDSSKDRKSGANAGKVCFGCGEIGHLRKNCKGEKKENGPRGRIL